MMSNQFEKATTTSGATAVASFSVEDLSKDTPNPELFIKKYEFYVNRLHFTPEEALRWAKRTVRVDNEIKVAANASK
jgi:hypothetical protein